VVKALNILNEDKKMWVVLLAHAKVTRYEDPEHPAYDKHTLDMNEKSGKFLMEFVDIIAFCNYQTATVTKKDGFNESVKVKSTGKRMMFLNNRAAYDAGNRYGLPDSLPLEFAALDEGIKKYFIRQKPGNLSEALNDE
jgi:hypothetical protein